MATPWWLDPITQAFNPPKEPGEDIGTPYGTPVTFLDSGTVIGATYGPYGGRIDVQLAGSGQVIDEYYQHLDEIAAGIGVGSHVEAGQLAGTSGGQLAGGHHPNQPGYSTGPHIEVGETIGGKPVNPAARIAAGPKTGDAGTGTGSASFDPWAWLQNLLIGSVKTAENPAYAAGQVAGSVAGATVAGGIAGAQQGLAGVYSSAVGPWLQTWIIPLVVAALVILVVLGSGDNKPQASPQVVPVPVPV